MSGACEGELAILGADQAGNRTLVGLGLLEGDGDPVNVRVGLDQVVVEAPGVQRRLGDTGGRVAGDIAPRVQPRYPTIITRGKLMSTANPRTESPDSKNPVFWIMTRGSLPPIHRPAAMAMLSASLQMGTMLIVGSDDSSWYMKLLSVSGSHIT